MDAPSITRSPLHGSALILGDKPKGRDVLVFNIHSGIIYEGTITQISLSGNVVLEDKKHFTTHHLLSVDMGLETYHTGTWNKSNFTIDVADRELLPEPIPNPVPPITEAWHVPEKPWWDPRR